MATYSTHASSSSWTFIVAVAHYGVNAREYKCVYDRVMLPE
jgi:hypothetical protein